jgi:hypothetical protein
MVKNKMAAKLNHLYKIKTFYDSFHIERSRLANLENQTGNRMVKNHSKAGYKYVWKSNGSGIQIVTVYRLDTRFTVKIFIPNRT